MTFTRFGPPPKDRPGFAMVAGRHNGLADLMVLAARLIPGDLQPVHAHQGDEVLRVLRGEVHVRIDEEVRVLRKDDVAVFGSGVPHGFRVREEAVIEIVAGYGIGTFYPVAGADGEDWVEVHRRDMPWGRPPAEGQAWTGDDEMTTILHRSTRPL